MSVVNPHTHNSWELWLEELSKPLSGLACGEDLKYEETFYYDYYDYSQKPEQPTS